MGHNYYYQYNNTVTLYFQDKVLSHLFTVELDESEDACGENCLNRLLMIEWYVITAIVYTTKYIDVFGVTSSVV